MRRWIKIQTQIRRHKERAKDWRHRPPRRDVIAQLHDTLEEADTVDSPDITSSPDTIDLPIDSPEIVSDPERFSPKPMTVEDAAMELQISGDTLLLFLNADTGQINLLYKTERGPYGWVEPNP